MFEDVTDRARRAGEALGATCCSTCNFVESRQRMFRTRTTLHTTIEIAAADRSARTVRRRSLPASGVSAESEETVATGGLTTLVECIGRTDRILEPPRAA
jgi:hypothetical protein